MVNEDTHGRLSVFGFIDNSIYCCDCAWLRKATDIGEVSWGKANRGEKRPAATGIFFDSSNCQSIKSYLLCDSACAARRKESNNIVLTCS